MTVFDSQEQLTEGGVMTRRKYFEALTLGLAVRPRSILDQVAPMLGSIVGAHLERFGLLRQPPYPT
jgi:hypothetical protein